MSAYTAERLLLKVASRCNLACTYCYWFKDPAVMSTPPLLSKEVENHFVRRLEDHAVTHKLDRFSIALHGGEPMLFGKKRFAELCLTLREVSSRTGCVFNISMQTNGTLLDGEWVDLIKLFDVNVGISLDGPAYYNDVVRPAVSGGGSFDKVVHGLRLLQNAGMDPGVLAVWSPLLSAQALVHLIADDLQVNWFDVLMPDATLDDTVPDISTFYIELFDLWLTELHARGITVRCAENFVRAVTGHSTSSESIGLNPVTTFSVNTAGEYELLDVFNILGNSYARTGQFVSDCAISQVPKIPKWKKQVADSVQLCLKCRECRHHTACGGGYLPWRYSKSGGFDNPSAHCGSLERIFDHVAARVRILSTALDSGFC